MECATNEIGKIKPVSVEFYVRLEEDQHGE
jgi:hypothetical protein